MDDGVGGPVLLATVDGAGVFRSTDGGVTFQISNTGLTNLRLKEVEEDDDSDDTPTPIWGVTAGGGPFISTDLALSWTPASGSS